MLKEQFRAELIAELKANTLGLDVMLDKVPYVSLGNPTQDPSLFDRIGGNFLSEEKLEWLWRGWLFEVECEDGPYSFLAWDICNSHYDFMCDFTKEAITEYLTDRAS